MSLPPAEHLGAAVNNTYRSAALQAGTQAIPRRLTCSSCAKPFNSTYQGPSPRCAKCFSPPSGKGQSAAQRSTHADPRQRWQMSEQGEIPTESAADDILRTAHDAPWEPPPLTAAAAAAGTTRPPHDPRLAREPRRREEAAGPSSFAEPPAQRQRVHHGGPWPPAPAEAAALDPRLAAAAAEAAALRAEVARLQGQLAEAAPPRQGSASLHEQLLQARRPHRAPSYARPPPAARRARCAHAAPGLSTCAEPASEESRGARGGAGSRCQGEATRRGWRKRAPP